MTHGFRLGQSGQANISSSVEPAEAIRTALWFCEINTGSGEIAEFKRQQLFNLKCFIASEGFDG